MNCPSTIGVSIHLSAYSSWNLLASTTSSWPNHIIQMGVLPVQICSLCKNLYENICARPARSLGRKNCLLCKPGSATSIPEPKERWTERMEDSMKLISDIHKSSVTCMNTCVHMHAYTTHTYTLKNWKKNLRIGTPPYFGPNTLAARKLAILIRWESNHGSENAALASCKFFSRKFISKYPEVSRQHVCFLFL